MAVVKENCMAECVPYKFHRNSGISSAWFGRSDASVQRAQRPHPDGVGGSAAQGAHHAAAQVARAVEAVQGDIRAPGLGALRRRRAGQRVVCYW